MPSLSKPIYAIGIALSLIIAVAAAAIVAFFYIPYSAAKETGRGILAGIEKVSELSQFKPRIVIGERVVIESRNQIAEFATANRNFSHTYSWEHTYLGSTKKFTIKGDFVAKAGYRLNSPAELHLPQGTSAVKLVLPDATLLSNEVKTYDIVVDEDGYWNKLSAEDREQALNGLKKSADAFIVESGLLQEAEDAMVEHIRKAVHQSVGPSISIERVTPPVP